MLEHVAIRAIRPDDAAALRELRLEALRDNPLAFTADVGESEAQPPEHWKDLATRASGAGLELIMVADARGELEAMTGIYLPKQPKLRHSGIMWGVYVKPAARGRGLGEALIRSVLDWARDRKLATVRLSVVATNHSAKRCYERCGFAVYGVEPMAVQWEGKFYDEFLMVCRL
jgi:ribosomal protein S18 acetylase RimI-like enzyme